MSATTTKKKNQRLQKQHQQSDSSILSRLPTSLLMHLFGWLSLEDMARAFQVKPIFTGLGGHAQPPLILPHVVVQGNHRHPSWNRFLRRWAGHVARLRLDASAVDLTVWSRPIFPKLQALHVCGWSNCTPELWRFLIDSSPLLIDLNVTFLSNSTIHTESDWTLLPTTIHRPWRRFLLCHRGHPRFWPSLALAVANPRLEAFSLGKVPSWTLAQVKSFVDKWEGHGDRVTFLKMSPNVLHPDEWEPIVLLIAKHFPELRELPWDGTIQVSSVAARAMYAQWSFMTRMPPDRHKIDVVDVETFTLDKTRAPLTEFNSYVNFVNLDVFVRTLRLSLEWRSIYYGGSFCDQVDAETLFWLSTNAVQLRELVLDLGCCSVTDALLESFAKHCPQLRCLKLGDRWPGTADALTIQPQVKLAAVVRLVETMTKNKAEGEEEHALSLISNVFSSIDANDLDVLANWLMMETKSTIAVDLLVTMPTATAFATMMTTSQRMTMAIFRPQVFAAAWQALPLRRPLIGAACCVGLRFSPLDQSVRSTR